MKFVIMILFLILVGCETDTKQQDIECQDGFVYNSRFEMCVKDICETKPENTACEMGCVVYETDEELSFFCVKK